MLSSIYGKNSRNARFLAGVPSMGGVGVMLYAKNYFLYQSKIFDKTSPLLCTFLRSAFSRPSTCVVTRYVNHKAINT